MVVILSVLLLPRFHLIISFLIAIFLLFSGIFLNFGRVSYFSVFSTWSSIFYRFYGLHIVSTALLSLLTVFVKPVVVRSAFWFVLVLYHLYHCPLLFSFLCSIIFIYYQFHVCHFSYLKFVYVIVLRCSFTSFRFSIAISAITKNEQYWFVSSYSSKCFRLDIFVFYRPICGLED